MLRLSATGLYHRIIKNKKEEVGKPIFIEKVLHIRNALFGLLKLYYSYTAFYIKFTSPLQIIVTATKTTDGEITC